MYNIVFKGKENVTLRNTQYCPIDIAHLREAAFDSRGMPWLQI